MKQYLDLLNYVATEGQLRQGRNGEETLASFGHQLRFNLKGGDFPLVTTRQIKPEVFIKETLWFLRGETNTATLGSKIWDKWADENGELGPIYGKQWRAWQGQGGTIDQLQRVIETLKKDPFSRRLVVSAWNVSDLDKMALPPCHVLFQFHTTPCIGQRYLDLSISVIQRSADLCVGVPFNIASYSLILRLVASVVKMAPKEIIWYGTDCHIYTQHLPFLKRQLARKPLPLPYLLIKKNYDRVEDYKVDDIEVINYSYEPPLKYEVTV